MHGAMVRGVWYIGAFVGCVIQGVWYSGTFAWCIRFMTWYIDTRCVVQWCVCREHWVHEMVQCYELCGHVGVALVMVQGVYTGGFAVAGYFDALM